MSATNRGRISYRRQEDDSAVASNPTWQQFGITTASLSYQKQTTQSGVLDASNQPVDTVKVGAKASGNIATELTGVKCDDFLEAAFRGTYGNTVSATGAAVIVAAAKTLTKTGAFTNAVVGQALLLHGFVAGESYSGAGDSPNNGWWRIASVTNANEVVLLDPAGQLVNETAPVTATIKSRRLINGTRSLTYAIEQALTDVQSYWVFLGQKINTMNMSMSAGNVVTAEFGFMGTNAFDEQGVQETTGTATVVASTRTITMTGAFERALVGQKVTFSGFAASGNNVTGTIATVVSDDAITLTAATTTLVDVTSATNVTVIGAAPSWSVGGSYTAETTRASLNATNNVGNIFIDNDLSTACFRSLNIALNHNIRETYCIGSEFPSLDYGSPALTGTFERLFVDIDLWRTMKDHSTMALDFGFVNEAGTEGMHFYIPAARINTNPVDLSGGNNSDVLDKVDWAAVKATVGSDTFYCQVCVP